jgi:hypothetical protein
MPNIRGAGQKPVLIFMHEEFIAQIDIRLPGMGYSDRAKFIRDAVYEKLERESPGVLRELSLSPNRVGKGGSAKKYKITQRQSQSQGGKL